MVGHRVAISQSNYVPWRGYFDLIDSVDEFVIYDEVQFTRRDWRNRNRIKTANGLQWLTIPVQSKGNYYSKVSEIRVDDPGWNQNHWRAIELAYSKAEWFPTERDWLSDLYTRATFDELSRVNRHFIEAFMGKLQISTPLRDSSDFVLADDRNERLLNICIELGATAYVSGPAAKDYLDENLFKSHGISVEWFNYEGYEPYPQLWGDFVDGLSIVDLVLNWGPSSERFAKRKGSE